MKSTEYWKKAFYHQQDMLRECRDKKTALEGRVAYFKRALLEIATNEYLSPDANAEFCQRVLDGEWDGVSR